ELWALNIARQEAAELAGKLVNIPRTPGSREPTAGLLSLEGEGIPLISGKGYRIQGMEFPTKSGQGVKGFSVRTRLGIRSPATRVGACCWRRPRCTRRSPSGLPPAWRRRRHGSTPS